MPNVSNTMRSTEASQLPSLEGLLESRPTSVASINTCLNAHCVVVSRRKATYCAQKWIIIRVYNAHLLRTNTFNVCLVALNHVVFLGFLNFHPDAAPTDINKPEVRRG